MTDLYTSLAWLPAAPKDISARSRALGQLPTDERVAESRRLSRFSLNLDQLIQLSRGAVSPPGGGDAARPGLTAFRLGIVSNATLDMIRPALVATALRFDIALECVCADFGQSMQSVLDPGSVLNTSDVDAVLVSIDYRGFSLAETPGDREGAEATVAGVLAELRTISDAVRRNARATCILQTLARPPETLFGSLDASVPGTFRSLVGELNPAIARLARDTGDVLLDVAGLAETVGLANWHNPTLWNIGKLPFDADLIPLFCDHVARLIGAIRGKSRRCLVLDLDNTLWGGVIGDDGMNGIALGQGDPTGEAHLALQSTAVKLRQRGVVLAVSSKNDDAVAREAFRDHPEMALTLDDVAVFQANWNDKATNIDAIATEIQLGLESIAFVDDNPFERALVRETLPGVAIPEMPDDPAYYSRLLLASGLFESSSFSDEDRKRADYYQANAKRNAIQVAATDISAYLRSLEMVIDFKPFDAANMARISQLVNKSNQFNLTTRRYTERDLDVMTAEPDAFTLQVRLTDRLGDNGMISVIICRRAGPGWEIDTWLMSCRVLGRQVEEAVVRELLAHAPAHGVTTILGTYIPTSRNGMVAGHYEKLGFAPAGAGDTEGSTRWELAVAGARSGSEPLIMEVRRSGFGPS